MVRRTEGLQRMVIRPYSQDDRRSCLEILEDNTPEFFVAGDRDSLAKFLSQLPGPYFVGEDQGAIVACGGWALDSVDVAALTWGMVRRAHHRRGLGRALLNFRLDSIKKRTQAHLARIQTVQLVQGFFAKEGFTIVHVEADGFGLGLDRVTMELKLRDAVERGC